MSCSVALVEEPTRLLHLPDIPLKVQGPHSGVNTRMAPGHQKSGQLLEGVLAADCRRIGTRVQAMSVAKKVFSILFWQYPF